MATSISEAASLLEESKVLTATVLDFLATGVLKDADAAVIAKKSKAEFALQLKQLLPDDLKAQALSIAGAFLEELRAMEIGNEPALPEAAQQQAAAPVEVVVKMPISHEQMGVKDLLANLAENPNEAGEILILLNQKPQVIAAHAKTTKIAIRNAEGGLDPTETLGYINHLAQSGTAVLPQYKGKRPCALEVALGIEARTFVHPLTGESVKGLDSTYGQYDFAEMSEERHLAILWAMRTKHRAFPQVVDLYQHLPEIFYETLQGRWQTILEDYRDARKSGDSSAEGLSRFYVESEKKPIDPPGGIGLNTATKGEQYYRNLVLAQPSITVNTDGMGNKKYDQVLLAGGNGSGMGYVTFNGSILIGNIHYSGMGNFKGTLFTAPGVSIQMTGLGDDKTMTKPITWQQIAEKLGLE